MAPFESAENEVDVFYRHVPLRAWGRWGGILSRMKNAVQTIFNGRTLRVFIAAAFALLLCLGCIGCVSSPSNPAPGSSDSAASVAVEVVESGQYTSKDEVAAYIHEFGHLPSNFISKTKARKAGWVANKGNLDEVCPGKSIGGSTFYNDDGKLPEASGRSWKECDIGYEGGYRGAERIVFSNDGLVFYTADHYKTFEQLY